MQMTKNIGLILENHKGSHLNTNFMQQSQLKELSYDPKGILTSGKLNPQFSRLLEMLLLDARAEGLNVFLFEGFRSQEKQDELFISGRGVTTAKGGNSYHNYGLAADIIFYDDKGHPSWSQHHDWQKLGRLGKKRALEWGGDFKRLKDLGHFEYHPGLSMRGVKEIYKKQGILGVWNKITD